jgi:endoglucanase
MNTRLCLLLPIAAILSAAMAADEPRSPKPGEVAFKTGFHDAADRAKWSKAAFARWAPEGADGSTCLVVQTAAGEKPGSHMIVLPFDLAPYRGAVLYFECRAKAEKVSTPPQVYQGVKFMLHYKSAEGGRWHNASNLHGTFDWKTISFPAPIAEDASDGQLLLGLEMSTGKAWFDDIVVTVSRQRPPSRPAPKLNASPPYRGHDLPRLRGVMSPNQFKDEDLRVLGMEWKANLIRWQLTRNWGKPGTDRDLDEYDKWLDGKLDELDKALAACKRYGLKAVIDVHSPPGARYEDQSMAMLYEKKYQDHFVKTWEKIARRYKGNPAVWAYDLVNEPVVTKPPAEGMGYIETQVRAAKAIRAIDAATAIMIEADNWDSPDGFRWLVPVDVANVVYQVHMYVPGEFTHQGVYNATTGIAYPGMIGGRQYDKEALRKVLQQVRDFQLAYNVHIYVGEFSAIRWAPGAARYLSDCIDIFEDYGWDWSYHAYREWPGWSVEHENQPADRNVHKSATTDTDRKKVLLSWFAKNSKPPVTSELSAPATQ